MKIIALSLIFIGISSAIAQKTDSLPSRVYDWNSLKEIKEETRVGRQILEGSTTALSYFKVHASTLQPAKSPHPPHAHNDADELFIIKQGQVKITLKGVSKIIGPGSIAFVMCGDEHGIENAGNTEATYYVFQYKSRLHIDTGRAQQNGGSFVLDWNDLVLKKTELGGRRDFFKRPTSQLKKFEMHTTSLHPGLDSHAPHTHPEEEIILILKGNVQEQIGNNFYNAAPGDLIFLSSGVLHKLKNTGAQPCEYFAFQWRN